MQAGMTLYVVHTDRAPEIAADAFAAARWASQHTCTTLLVVGPGKAAEYRGCQADLVYESDTRDDFRFYDGLRYAINEGVDFEQAVCFRDDAVFLGKNVDDLLSKHLFGAEAQFVGVADRHYYGDHFTQVSGLFSEWRVPHETWDKAPDNFTAHSAVFALTNKLARALFNRRLLAPVGYARWPLSFGAYATWTCQLLTYRAALVGSMQKPLAPFYVNDGWRGAYNPPPYLLHPHIKLYWSLRHVAGYSEEETRTWCKTLRQVNP
jgi:hypothetical protein